MNAPQHPLIAAYAARHGLAPSTRADGRITVVIDDTYRVHLQPARDGWLAMSARLCALPAGDADRDRLVTEIGKLAAGMLARHASTCVVDPQGRGEGYSVILFIFPFFWGEGVILLIILFIFPLFWGGGGYYFF